MADIFPVNQPSNTPQIQPVKPVLSLGAPAATPALAAPAAPSVPVTPQTAPAAPSAPAAAQLAPSAAPQAASSDAPPKPLLPQLEKPSFFQKIKESFAVQKKVWVGGLVAIVLITSGYFVFSEKETGTYKGALLSEGDKCANHSEQTDCEGLSESCTWAGDTNICMGNDFFALYRAYKVDVDAAESNALQAETDKDTVKEKSIAAQAAYVLIKEDTSQLDAENQAQQVEEYAKQAAAAWQSFESALAAGQEATGRADSTSYNALISALGAEFDGTEKSADFTALSDALHNRQIAADEKLDWLGEHALELSRPNTSAQRAAEAARSKAEQIAQAAAEAEAGAEGDAAADEAGTSTEAGTEGDVAADAEVGTATDAGTEGAADAATGAEVACDADALLSEIKSELNAWAGVQTEIQELDITGGDDQHPAYVNIIKPKYDEFFGRGCTLTAEEQASAKSELTAIVQRAKVAKAEEAKRAAVVRAESEAQRSRDLAAQIDAMRYQLSLTQQAAQSAQTDAKIIELKTALDALTAKLAEEETKTVTVTAGGSGGDSSTSTGSSTPPPAEPAQTSTAAPAAPSSDDEVISIATAKARKSADSESAAKKSGDSGVAVASGKAGAVTSKITDGDPGLVSGESGVAAGTAADKSTATAAKSTAPGDVSSTAASSVSAGGSQATGVAAGAAAKSGASQTVSGAAASSAAKKVHGSYIRGETGPVLFYPVAIALANAAYYVARRRKRKL